MRFFVVDRGKRPNARAPYAVLERDRWNDYGYTTLFQLRVVLSPKESYDLGDVKIAQSGMSNEPEGRHAPELPSSFESLPADYVSLGQDFGYYEVVSTMPASVRVELMTALQDAVWIEAKEQQFSEEDAWRTSLLRYGNAENALSDGRALFFDTAVAELPGEVGFLSTVGGRQFEARFTFTHTRLMTSRLNAIIGYNGSGKTRLLANLGQVAHADRRKRTDPTFQSAYGSFSGDQPTYSATIMVSYSAWDTFDWPTESPPPLTPGEEVRGFSYCGLRITDANRGASQGGRLKSFADLEQEFVAALTRIRALDRVETFDLALEPLLLEPSFLLAARPDGLGGATEDEAREYFRALSTGHKIALSMLAHLTVRLQPRSLVLLDEPEAHLHPSLLAALLRSVSSLLNRYESHGVAATHSPVVLQEIPAVCVSLLRRRGTGTTAAYPSIETFGENVGLITAHVFHMDSTATDFHDRLDALAETSQLDDVEELFLYGMSSEARSYFLSQASGSRT